jgi:hypothetical protein
MNDWPVMGVDYDKNGIGEPVAEYTEPTKSYKYFGFSVFPLILSFIPHPGYSLRILLCRKAYDIRTQFQKEKRIAIKYLIIILN